MRKSLPNLKSLAVSLGKKTSSKKYGARKYRALAVAGKKG